MKIVVEFELPEFEDQSPESWGLFVERVGKAHLLFATDDETPPRPRINFLRPIELDDEWEWLAQVMV